MTFSSNFIHRPRDVIPGIVQPVYANQYVGEWLNIQLGDRLDRRFYRPRQEFYRAGGRAIVLGNGTSRNRWPLQRLNKSNSQKRLEHYNVLYGCNRAFQDQGELDFLVVTHRFLPKEIPDNLHKIIYTRPEIQRVHENMELLPLNHRLDAGASAVMLACFHGADKVFLFGFDGHDATTNNNIYAGTELYDPVASKIDDKSWQQNLMLVMLAYPKVNFYRVESTPASARILTSLTNYQIISFNEFVSLADL